jgi:hypothetical protein
MNWPELIAEHFNDWLANPIPSVLTLALGSYLGFLVSRMRHQGKIDTLEERVRHKVDQIEVKEQAIQKLSADANELKAQMSPASPSTPPAVATSNSNPSMRQVDRFWAANEEITKNAEARILKAIATTRYKFVFNPISERSKFLTFLKDGTIGEGKNNNETRWRVRAGQLEILNSRHEVYSRFNLLEDGLSFHHTNEPGLLSIKGQYMVPISIIPAEHV